MANEKLILEALRAIIQHMLYPDYGTKRDMSDAVKKIDKVVPPPRQEYSEW